MDHYSDNQKSWEDIFEKACMFFQHHHCAFFFLGVLAGLILKPILIGWVFLFWILTLAWTL
jgi:hypothetical protein